MDVRLGVAPNPGIPDPILGRADTDGLDEALEEEGVTGAEGWPRPNAEGVRDRDASPGVRGTARPLPNPACKYADGG